MYPGTKKNSRRFSTSATALLAAVPLLFCARIEAQISLATVVDQAQRNSSTVKLADADQRKAFALLAQSKDVYIPNLLVGSSIGPPSIGFPSGQPSVANASMQSLAFSFAQRQYIKAAQAGYDAAALNLKDAREQVALDASTDYIELDTVTQELAAAQQQVGFSKRSIDIEEERSEAGIDSKSDLLQAQLIAAQLRLKLIHLQTRAATLIAQLSMLTGLPVASIAPDHGSIPQVPAVASQPILTVGIQAVQAQARSKQLQAYGDSLFKYRPQIGFGAQYNRDATSLNNYNQYFGRTTKSGTVVKPKADNFSAGFSIQIPLYDRSHRDKAQETTADSLRATVEAEQAQRQNDVQIASLTGNLRELEALAEVASLKQQIAAEQLKAIQIQLESGNGAGIDPGAPPQLSPKTEQQAHIDERQKYMDALDTSFDLTKARLSLLRALGHMDDWLREVTPAAPGVQQAAK